MWNDIETITDYLHFSVVSKTVADLIIESGDNPISIGGSGSFNGVQGVYLLSPKSIRPFPRHSYFIGTSIP